MSENKQPSSPIIKRSVVDLLFLLLVLLAIACLVFKTLNWMQDERRMPLSYFVLQGDLNFIKSQDIQQQLTKQMPLGTFMTQDVNLLQQAIEDLAWVNHASIRKQWPNTIKIFVVEHKAVAIWNGTSLLNQSGALFDPDATYLETLGLVKLYGPYEKRRYVLDTYKNIEPKFSHGELIIDSLVLNDRTAWQIILDNGIRLELGTDALEERIERFFGLYAQLGERQEQVSYIDLRYDTGAAIGWTPEQDIIQESHNE